MIINRRLQGIDLRGSVIAPRRFWAAMYLRVAALVEFRRLMVAVVSSLLALAGRLLLAVLLPWQAQLSVLLVPPFCDSPKSLLPFLVIHVARSQDELGHWQTQLLLSFVILLGKTARFRAHSPTRNQSSSHVKPRLYTIPYAISPNCQTHQQSRWATHLQRSRPAHTS